MRPNLTFQAFFAGAILSLVVVSTCPAQELYLLEDTSVVHRLDTHTAIFIDPSGRATFDQIIQGAYQARFKPSTGNLTFGYLRSAIWLKLRLAAASPGTRWYLEIPAPFLEHVDFYQANSSGKWHHSSSGYYHKHSERAVSHTGHVLPLRFQSDGSSVVYVRISGLSPKTFPLYAIEEGKFMEKTRFEDLWYGVFFGILMVMFFYNLFIYLILRQKSYLYYFCTIVCTFLIFAAISGYGGKFLWPEVPLLNYFSGKLSLEALVVFLSLFTIVFLDVEQYSKAAYYLLLSLFPLAGLALVLVVTNTFAFAGNTLVSFASLVFMGTGIVVRVNGNRTANYFIAAWSIYFAGGLLISLRNSGFFDYNFWTTHFVEIGAVVETAIIGFALGHQYRKFKKEKEDAQTHALRVQEEAMAWLEGRVNERTEELSKAYEQLRHTLEANERQTVLIQHKNAELDSFFFRISHDLKGPVLTSLGLTLLAKLEVKDPHALEYFEKQQVQLERLSNIIEGLLKLTKLNDGDLQPVRIDFGKLIDDCILSFHSSPNFSKISFRKEIQPRIVFYSEWTLLNGILQNLIENSIKYACDADPYVRVVVRQESGWIVIEVEDNGQGISEEHQSRIFEMFYRATKSENGSGLGLYILKRSVDRLKGTIDIRSTPGAGSTFTVRLPSMKEAPHEVEI